MKKVLVKWCLILFTKPQNKYQLASSTVYLGMTLSQLPPLN